MTDIRLIAFDVDGTLTAGHIHLDSEGGEAKEFTVLDGVGFRLAEISGISIAIISGRSSMPVLVRMANLPIENVLLGIRDKAKALHSVQARLGISEAETAFVGDDLNDLPAFEAVGVKIAVANAMPAVKRQANYVTKRRGGEGAAREALEWLLRKQNVYNDAVSKYLERELSNV